MSNAAKLASFLNNAPSDFDSITEIKTYVDANSGGGSETLTTLYMTGNQLNYIDENNTTTSIDLSLYLDDTNLSRITGGSLDNSTGIATFSRDDGSNFTVDFSSLIGGGSGVTTLSGLSDTSINIPTEGQFLSYASGAWRNVNAPSGGGGSSVSTVPINFAKIGPFNRTQLDAWQNSLNVEQWSTGVSNGYLINLGFKNVPMSSNIDVFYNGIRLNLAHSYLNGKGQIVVHEHQGDEDGFFEADSSQLFLAKDRFYDNMTDSDTIEINIHMNHSRTIWPIMDLYSDWIKYKVEGTANYDNWNEYWLPEVTDFVDIYLNGVKLFIPPWGENFQNWPTNGSADGRIRTGHTSGTGTYSYQKPHFGTGTYVQFQHEVEDFFDTFSTSTNPTESQWNSMLIASVKNNQSYAMLTNGRMMNWHYSPYTGSTANGGVGSNSAAHGGALMNMVYASDSVFEGIDMWHNGVKLLGGVVTDENDDLADPIFNYIPWDFKACKNQQKIVVNSHITALNGVYDSSDVKGNYEIYGWNNQINQLSTFTPKAEPYYT